MLEEKIIDLVLELMSKYEEEIKNTTDKQKQRKLNGSQKIMVELVNELASNIELSKTSD